MYAILIISSGILGIIVGSFLNVVIYRMGTGRGIGGRSMCLSCNRNLNWYELIPIISFVIQRAKCRKCKSEISWQYPLVELCTGILFAVAAYCITFNSHFSLLIPAFIFISTGVVISVYDIRHRVIHLPSLLVFFIAGIAFVATRQFLGGDVFTLSAILFSLRDAVLVALPFFLLWWISRGTWIGFGDIEIMAITGFLLGLAGGYSAVFLGFWIACAIIVPMYLFMKLIKQPMHHQIPLGPFLLIGIYLVLICGWDVFALLQRVVQ